jgi:multiple sugar transport system ATP-binding protein
VHLEGGSREGGAIVAKLPGDGGVARDDRIELTLAPEACHVFDEGDFAVPRLH